MNRWIISDEAESVKTNNNNETQQTNIQASQVCSTKIERSINIYSSQNIPPNYRAILFLLCISVIPPVCFCILFFFFIFFPLFIYLFEVGGVFHCAACRILISPSEIKPWALGSESRVLTTGLLGNSQQSFLILSRTHIPMVCIVSSFRCLIKHHLLKQKSLNNLLKKKQANKQKCYFFLSA